MPEQYTLLLVDDNPDNLDMLGRRLRKKGYKVLACPSGKDALQTLAKDPVDLVILDVMMPEMSGLEVVERIRKEPHWKAIPIIMATAKSESEDVVAALDLGADDYVPKPIDVDILLARVRVHLRGRPPRTAQDVASGHKPPPIPESLESLKPGTIIDGKYRIEGQLGSGGFGVVYRASHLHLATNVAVKIVHRHLLSRQDVVRRFQREGMSGFRVRHVNAVAILDAGVAEIGPYLVMELLEGHTLEDELKKEKVLPLSRAAQVMVPVCDALMAAHSAGLIHRDIKPANILLARQSGSEVVKVLDFGIATFVDTPVKNSNTTDTFLGTPAFIAPESLTGKSVDDRSDIYSVGVTLYSLLTGKLPHRADSESPLLQVLAQLHSPAVPIEKRRFDLPREVCKMIMAAISSEPQLRPSLQNIKELLLGYTSGLADLSSPELSESGMFLPLAATLLNSDEEEDPAPSSLSNGKPRR